MTAKPKPPQVIQAAGAVIVRPAAPWGSDHHHEPSDLTGPHEPEVALVHRPKYDDWSWPKGKLEAGETLIQCAHREVGEEVGVAVDLLQRLQVQRYALPGRPRSATQRPLRPQVKEVTYWLARLNPNLQPKAPRAPRSEIDEVRWVPLSEAEEALSYEKDRTLVKLARQALQEMQ